jgi:1,4-alpha-glucan branching enzyme
MYEQFGFSRWPNGRLGFQLFIPDNQIDAAQYGRGGPCKITEVRVVGDFQTLVDPAAINWNAGSGLLMTRLAHPNGHLFTYELPNGFPDGYYQYKYVVTFQNGAVRWVGDPCTRYGGDSHDNSAFVVGGQPATGTRLAASKRPGAQELVIYELMIDDFTAGYRGNRAPMDAVADKLDEIKALGVNAVEFMPWISWPDDAGFSWGYNPAYFFSVESHLIADPAAPLERLSRVAWLIDQCHQRDLMVILDIVLQHALQGPGTSGFPYYWLWQELADCPFIGKFTNDDAFGSAPLDYHNACTQEFVVDVCKYWTDRFGVDGFRFDQVSGYHNPDFPQQGAPALVQELKAYLANAGVQNFPLILEDTWDYRVIQDTNDIGATHGWFDLFRSRPQDALPAGNRLQPEYLRVLNSARDFRHPAGPVSYLENHDHSTLMHAAGGRHQWYRVQPYLIALATSPGAVMLANGQEFGRVEYLPEMGQETPQIQRVQPRRLRWSEAYDEIGATLKERCRFLLTLRRDHPGLLSPNFYPDFYDQQWRHFSPEGYGIDVDREVVIFHRWGDAADGRLERFTIVLNFSGATQWVEVPLATNGVWTDLLNGNTPHTVNDYRLHNHGVSSNWGCIFHQKT